MQIEIYPFGKKYKATMTSEDWVVTAKANTIEGVRLKLLEKVNHILDKVARDYRSEQNR